MYECSLEVLKKIHESKFSAYIVGGYPRDLYLGRTSVDIDICTNATPKQLKEIFKDSILPKQEYGGVTIIHNGIRFEITTFRKEIKYENNRFPVKIKYIDNLVDDLERRDFTINTLCLAEDGKYIDLLNAKVDLDNKIIRTVGSSDDKIKTDILRSLRAIRFATILDFKLDDSLKRSIIKYSYLLKNLSYYRKKEELNKIFASSNCLYGISLLCELQLDKVLELNNIKDLVPTITPLAIWAQLGVVDIYGFTNYEKEVINNVNAVLKSDPLNNLILYKYGLYICTLVCEIKQIDRKLVVERYNNLPIKNSSEIVLKAKDICLLLNSKPGPFLKEIITDLETKIINGELENQVEPLKKHVLDNFISKD